MTPATPARRDLLRRGSHCALMVGAAFMVLPRIDIAFPRGRHDTDREGDVMRDKVERRAVIWEDRRIVLFDNNSFLPTVSIEFAQDKAAPEEGSVGQAPILALTDFDEGGPSEGVEAIEAVPPPSPLKGYVDPLTEVSPEPTMDGQGNDDGLDVPIESEEDHPLQEPSLSHGDHLEDGEVLDKVAVLHHDLEVAPPEYEGPTESIHGGALVLIEGEKGKRARDLVQAISLGILQNGLSVTYVATSQSVQDLIMEMYEKDDQIASYLPDHRLRCVPVYPLIEGRGTSEGLLDKLMGSEQLQSSDALVIDSLSDFLSDRFDEMMCMHLLEYVQHVNAQGKAVFLTVNDGQKGILPLRLESELQLSLASEDKEKVQMKRYRPVRKGAPELLRFHIDPDKGLLPYPLSQITG